MPQFTYPLKAKTVTRHRFQLLKSVKVGWGKISMVGQSGSLKSLFCMPKIKEPKVKRSTFLFFHRNRKNKIDDFAIISSLAFTPEMKRSSDSLCPAILILPHPTLGLRLTN